MARFSNVTKTTCLNRHEMDERKVENAEELFTIRTKPSTSHTTESRSISNKENTGNDNVQCDAPQEPDAILSIFWKSNKIGAAYYKRNDRQLYVVSDVLDQPPQFLRTKSLHRSVNPLYTITMGSMDDPFIKCLIDIHNCEEGREDEATIVSDEPRTLPAELSLLSFKEYTFEVCRSAVQNVPLLSVPAGHTESEKDIYLHSLMNFEATLSVYALGALIKFLNSNWARFDGNEQLHFFHINQISLENHVLMDRNTFDGLQIFQSRSHDSTFMKGLQSNSREGLSIYKLFSMHCRSSLGQKVLRYILLNPVNDVKTLNMRLGLISFAINMKNKALIQTLHDNFKDLEDVHNILSKIQHARATVRNWESLYKTMVHIISASDICSAHRHEVPLFNQLYNAVTPELYGLVDAINDAIDFTNRKRTRPVIKFGLDENLDAKKLRRQDIGKHVTAAANFAVDRLPHYFTVCSIIYIPEMGHLIVVKEWEPNLDKTELQNMGFQFMFEIKGELYYKNPMCVELDAQLGEINIEIIAHENRIIQRLSGCVISYNRNIREPLRILALLDCLIAMAKVAELNNYVCPTINTENIHDIRDARHPLLELGCSHYEPNSFRSGGQHPKVKVLTGPNASGKSVYLKQTALIIFLAHVGSFVPATRANIAVVHSIHSRMGAKESAAVRLSAFMIDLTQMSQAIYSARASSFVTIDEFGRGTTGYEGIAILAGALKRFIDQEEFCPHVLMSTHLQQVLAHFPDSPNLETLKMEHSKCEGKLVFTYKVGMGVSDSYAFDMAKAMGLGDDIVNRARAIFRCLQENMPLMPMVSGKEKENEDVLVVPKPCDG